jgi:hypothetical protein
MKTVSDAIQSSSHYQIGDLGIELIDIIKAKLPAGAYQWFLWASAEQYSFRFMNKGYCMEDLRKRDTYAKWLREDIEERGMRMDIEQREWRSAEFIPPTDGTSVVYPSIKVEKTTYHPPNCDPKFGVEP